MRKSRYLLLISLLISALLPSYTSNAAVTGAPSAPQSITQSSNTTGITLNWSAPAYTGANGVTSYRIEYSTNGSSWTLANTVASNVTTYTVGGLTPSTTYYFRVAAFSNSTRGANGYPWTKIYGTTAKNRNSSSGINYETGYGITAGDTSTTVSSSFTRVRYLLNTTISSVSNYADVDFEKWITTSTDSATASTVSSNIANLRIPTNNGVSANQFVIQANVNDLNVYSDNTSVSNGYGILGRLEIWPWDYGWGPSGLIPQGSNGTYDYDDLPANASGSYGSFQVHDLENRKPVFAWNHHGYGQDADVGYGANPIANPDWTFCYYQNSTWGYCPIPSSFRLQIFVNTPITTVANLATTASVSVTANPEFRKATTISYTTTTPGKVTFLEAGKSISGCKNITVITTASCSWKPSKRNAQIVSARLVPTNGALSNHISTASVYILKRSTSR